MRTNKHLLLWSSVAVMALLVIAAVQENLLKEWRRIQHAARSRTAPDAEMEVHLRQNVVPALNVVDRCVSCHVGMAPGEPAVPGDLVLKPHPDVVHDPGNLGCTVCHGGQGRATELADAHGDVPFWPEPMIPRSFVYAGCGSCHTHLAVPDLQQLHRGAALFERYDCLACHRLDGRGGTQRQFPSGGMEGPDLSRVGAVGFPPDWYERHLGHARSERTGAWPTLFSDIPADHRRAIDVFLGSRVGAPGLVEAKALFHSLGCRGCHRIGGIGGDDGPDLTHEGEIDPARLDFSAVRGEETIANWQAAHLRAPALVVPGSQMPALPLDDRQIERLSYYLFSLRRHDNPEAFWPKDRVRAERLAEREFATDGETLFRTFCTACHGPDGKGMRFAGMPSFPAVASPDFLELASDGFLTETIRQGRPGRRMPAWGESEGGLRADEIDRIVAHVRRLGGVQATLDERPRRWVVADPTAGEGLYRAHCSGCHGAHGEGKEGPALSNPVLLRSATDTYLVETVLRGRRGTTMKGFATPSPIRPALSRAEVESIVAFLRTWEK